MLANRGLARIGTIRQYFINHDLSAARLVVFVGECAALEQRCVHRFEVARKHDERIDCFIPARVGEGFFGAPANRTVATRERKWI